VLFSGAWASPADPLLPQRARDYTLAAMWLHRVSPSPSFGTDFVPSARRLHFIEVTASLPWHQSARPASGSAAALEPDAFGSTVTRARAVEAAPCCTPVGLCIAPATL
jgi:hypothetical protein